MIPRLILFFTLMGCVFASSANPVQWSKAVEKGNLEVLEQAQKNGKLPPSWQMLLKALKLEDGDSAARMYDQITDLYPTEEPSSIAYKRLREYAESGGELHTVETKPTQDVPVAIVPEEKNVLSAPPVVSTTPIVNPTPPATPSGKYAAQFGAYSSEQKALQITSNLRNSGFAGEIVPLNRNGVTLYRVWGGRFKTRSEATQCIIQVQQRFPELNATIVDIQ